MDNTEKITIEELSQRAFALKTGDSINFSCREDGDEGYGWAVTKVRELDADLIIMGISGGGMSYMYDLTTAPDFSELTVFIGATLAPFNPDYVWVDSEKSKRCLSSGELIEQVLSPYESFAELFQREKQWRSDAEKFLIKTLRQHGGRISFTPRSEHEEYPVTASLYGKHDFPRIKITDVYLNGDGTYMLADGMIDSEVSQEERGGFSIEPEQISDILSFVYQIIN